MLLIQKPLGESEIFLELCSKAFKGLVQVEATFPQISLAETEGERG
jgi:hypothetical protein